MNIRKAELKDTTYILNLIQELAKFERQPEAVIITEEDLVRYSFSEHPLIYTWVAEIDSEIVGIALYYFRFSTWKGRSLHLEDLIVKENHRQKGIGRALINKVIEIAHTENVGRMEWEVLEWNQPAIDFYHSLGATIDPEWSLCKLYREDLVKLVSI